jgi:hypothetical protein
MTMKGSPAVVKLKANTRTAAGWTTRAVACASFCRRSPPFSGALERFRTLTATSRSSPMQRASHTVATLPSPRIRVSR